MEINTLGIARCPYHGGTGPRRHLEQRGCVQVKQPEAGGSLAATAHPGTGRYSSQQESSCGKELHQHKKGTVQPVGPMDPNRAEHPAGKWETTQLPAGMEPSSAQRKAAGVPPAPERWPETRPGAELPRLSSTRLSCSSSQRWDLRLDGPRGWIQSGHAFILLLPCVPR